MENKAFTLIEMLVVVAIIAVLSSIILFSITQYINKSKDAAIIGNLVVLVPAGEVYYDHNTPDGYLRFEISSAFTNSWNAINSDNKQRKVAEDGNAWAACAQLTNAAYAYCVDSRGVKKEIDSADCVADITVCP